MDIEAIRAQADNLVTQFEHTRTGYAELQRKLQTVSASASSADGLITATVGPRGQLVRLEIDPRIYRRPDAHLLATAITETVQQAAAEAQALVADLCRPLVPDSAFQAQLDYDFEGLLRQLDADLPGVFDEPEIPSTDLPESARGAAE